MQCVNHTVFVDVEVKRVVGVFRVMRMASLRLFPRDDFAHVFDDGLALGNGRHGKHPLAMDARAAGLNSAMGSRGF